MELISSFTADQWGMVTAQQVKTLEIDRSTLHRLETAGYLDRVRHGVYASTTATMTAAREQQAAWLALNPSTAAWERPLLDPDGGVLSHQAAINLHGLGELPADRITFTTPRRRTSRDPDLWFKKAALSEDDVTSVDGLPVTTMLRTICDLLDQHIDGSHIATIIREGVIGNLVQIDELTEALGPYALRYGVRRPGDGLALLERLLAEIGTSVTDLVARPAPVTVRRYAAASKLAEALNKTHTDKAAAAIDFIEAASAIPALQVRAQLLDSLENRRMLTGLAAYLEQIGDSVYKTINPAITQTVLPTLRAFEASTLLPSDELAKLMTGVAEQVLRDDDTPRAITSARVAAIDEDDAHDSPTASDDLSGRLPQLGAEPGEARST